MFELKIRTKDQPSEESELLVVADNDPVFFSAKHAISHRSRLLSLMACRIE
jgi:hypothetical protein